jgi:crossover junction endodeoxyribonuclease RuvC
MLGIDPGSRITGFGVIDMVEQQRYYVASGCIRTRPAAPLSDRIRVIIDGLLGVIDMYKPQMAAVEQVFVNVNPSATLMLGQVRGACISALVLRNLPVTEYSALQSSKCSTWWCVCLIYPIHHSLMLPTPWRWL